MAERRQNGDHDGNGAGDRDGVAGGTEMVGVAKQPVVEQRDRDHGQSRQPPKAELEKKEEENKKIRGEIDQKEEKKNEGEERTG